MKRRQFLTLLAVGAVCAAPVFAQDLVQSIVAQLREQGFDTVITETTLLGRIRILATRDDGQREIILNPTSGEILRDLWTASVVGGASPNLIISSGNGPGEDSGSEGSGGDGGGDGGGDDGGGGDDNGGGDDGGGGGDDDGE